MQKLMEILKRKIEMIMTKEMAAPFSSVLEFILYLCSLAYGAIVRIRTSLYKNGVIKSKKLSCKVISIGNLTVGGTGKTPLAMYIGNLLKKSGYRVVIISRGYRGSAEKTGGIVSNGKMIQMAVEQAGDEPYLLSTRLAGIPVIVRVLLTLYGSGIRKIILPETGNNLKPVIEHWSQKKKLPVVIWKNGYGSGVVPPDSPVLYVRGGILFETSLLEWFQKTNNIPVTGNWEDHIVQEVIQYMDLNYRTIAKKESRAISGFSMGGFGALYLGLRHPDVYNLIYAIAPGVLNGTDFKSAFNKWKSDGGTFLNAYGATFSPDTTLNYPYAGIPLFDETDEDNQIIEN